MRRGRAVRAAEQAGRRAGARAAHRATWLLVAGLAAAVPAAAQQGEGAGDPAAGGAGSGESAPPVGLDQLLKLPSSLDYSVQTRGGQTPGEWRARFRRLEEALVAEREALAEAEGRLEDVARSTDPWTVGPALPGVATRSEAPLDYELRQEIRRRREEIERLERQLRELSVEADLAGVPPEWRR